MKKLTYLITAVAAAFSATAHADVSVSGSGSASYVNDRAGEGSVIVGSAVSFALSTTTANGIGISTSLSLSQDPDADGGPAGDGGQAVTFTTGGTTIVVGDVEIGDTPGSIGGVVGGIVGDNNGLDTSVESAFDDDDGTGVTLTTAVGGSTLTIGYIGDLNTNDNGNLDAATAETANSASISMPMGALTITAGIANSDTENSAGATAAYALGGGTLTVGYSQLSLTAALSGDATADDLGADGDTTIAGATYAMSLDADTSISVGYQNAKDADNESHTQTDLSISRSLGGGASVYLDVRTLSGDTAANGSGTAIGFGTSVSF